jgi:hypothetical protein
MPTASLNRLAAGEDAVVPVLWLYEASAVLAREQNRGTLAAPKADQLIAELQALRIVADTAGRHHHRRGRRIGAGSRDLCPRRRNQRFRTAIAAAGRGARPAIVTLAAV